MKRLTWITLVLVGAALSVAPVLADGPETGVLSGTVTDATGARLPGVMVTISGDRGDLTAISDAEGEYRFALMRPGEYAIVAVLEGFRNGEGIATVTAGKKAEVNMKLSLETSEEITVTSEAPMVDKFDVSTGGTVQAEAVEEVSAVFRGIYGAINMLPGVTNDQESTDLSSSRPSFNGSPWMESAVFIDGVDTTFTRYGATRMFIPTSATTEVSLAIEGKGAEYGRSIGGVTNVIVKSGTNQFHGDFDAVYRSLKWDSNYKPQPVLEEHPSRPLPADFYTLTPEERDADSFNPELSLGGPLVKDKAWFFAGYADLGTFTRDRTLNGDLIDQSTDVESYIAKLNFQPAQKHSLAASWIATPITRLFQVSVTADPYVPTMHDIGGSLVSATWNYSLSSNLFFETKLAQHTSSEDKQFGACFCIDPEVALAQKQQDPRFAPVPGLTSPDAPVNNYIVYIDSTDGSWNNGWLLDNGFGTNEYPRDQFNVAMSQFVGANHELRYGIDWQQTEWEQDVSHQGLYSGAFFDATNPYGYAVPTVYRDYNPPDVVAKGKGSGTTIGENWGIHMRDRWSIGDHWMVNLGLRIEDQTHENDIGRKVIESTDYSPRFTTVFDVKGDGKMLFNLSAGRYHTHIPQEMINSFMMDEWNGFNAQDQYFFIGGLGYVFNIGSIRPGRMWEYVDDGVYQHDIDPYGRDEAVLGFEWQFSKDWALSAKGIYWETFDQITNVNQIDSRGVLEGGASPLMPISANVNDLPRILRSMGWVEAFVADCQAQGRENCTADRANSILNGYEDPKRDYKALQLQVNRRFRNGWALYNHVTFARSDGAIFGSRFNNTDDSYGELLHLTVGEDDITECEFRNPGGGTDNPRAYSVDCGALRQYFGQPVSTVNRYGKAERERDIIFRTYGYKNFDLGDSGHSIQVGGQFTYQTPVRWNFGQTGTEQAQDGGNTLLDDSAYLNVEERGFRDTLDDVWWLNMSVGWRFPLGGKAGGGLRFEATNVDNQQDLIGVDETTGTPRSSKRYWSIPRKYRLLMNFKF